LPQARLLRGRSRAIVSAGHCNVRQMHIDMRILLLVSVFAVICRLAPAGEVDAFTPIVASVDSIDLQSPPILGAFGVLLTVQSPSTLAGTKLYLYPESKDRDAISRSYPLGARFSISLSSSQIEALARERRAQKWFKKQVDAGVRPELISEAVPIPGITLSILPFQATPHLLTK
jgi:hypothetical protein